VLSFFFGVLTLWAYIFYREKPGWPRYLAMAATYLLSLMAKPMLLTLPFVLLLLDYWPLRRAVAGPLAAPRVWGRLLREKVPLLVLAAASAVITHLARVHAGSLISLDWIPISARLANAVTAYGWYVSRTFAPVDLAVLYPHPLRNWSVPAALAGTALLMVVTGLAWWQARRRPWLLVGWLWFVGTLIPVIGLAQGGEQAWADRFSHWPQIGLLGALVWELSEVVRRWQMPALVPVLAGGAALCCLGVLTWIQVGYWHDVVILWERALAVTPDNGRAHLALGKYYLDRGQLDEAGSHLAEAVRLKPAEPHPHYLLGAALQVLGLEEEAADQFQRALDLAPEYPPALQALATIQLNQEQPEEAVRHFHAILARQPDSAVALAGLGQALLALGQRREALDALHAALAQSPGNVMAWQGLGRALLSDGKPTEALAALEHAVRGVPQLPSAYSDLGIALGRQGRWADAVRAHTTALQMQGYLDEQRRVMHGRPSATGSLPDLVSYQCWQAFALNRIGNHSAAEAVYREALARDPTWPQKFATKALCLATAAQPDRRDPWLAADLAGQAIEGLGEPSAAMLDALAAAQAALGQFPDAVRTARQALQRATDSEPTLVASIRDHLRHYEQGEPASSPD
jgi:tetratricopeptide (TPR) repeat protein